MVVRGLRGNGSALHLGCGGGVARAPAEGPGGGRPTRPMGMKVILGQPLKSCLEEAQIFGLVDHFKAAGLLTLLEDLQH